MSIIVDHISKSFGTQRALDDVSFTIESNEVVGFLGPNGAGKSTMMKILTTGMRSDEGQAHVNGYSVNEAPLQVQKSVGYLPEHNPLYLDQYVREYLKFHCTVHGVPSKRIPEVIQLTGLEQEAHKRIGALSKGYRQRVGLAAALLHDPEVLILDEPTTGLDPNQLVDIRHLIKSLGSNKTVLLSTHIMQEVEAMCDRVIIIDKGKIVADHRLADLRRDQDQIVVVEFDYRVEPQLLEALSHISKVENTHDFEYELTFKTTQDMRPAVFDFAHDNQLKILQLHLKHRSLEQLFREATQP